MNPVVSLLLSFSPRKIHILQSVYDLFDLQDSEYPVDPEDATFESSLILIGHSLDEERLRTGFEGCVEGAR